MRLSSRAALSLLVVAAAPALAGDGPGRGRFCGLEWPGSAITWKLGHEMGGQPGKPATRTCLVFARYAVLSSDEGGMGVEDLELRVRPAGMAPAEVCVDGFRGRSVHPTGEAASDYPLGVFGRQLFVIYGDRFGVLAAGALLDLESGKTVFQDEYEDERGITFERGREGPVLTYWSPLKDLDCIPRRGEAACWSRVRERNGIPATVPQPDCEAAIAKEPTMLQGEVSRAAQITVHVRVPRLSRREATYLPDRPGCAPKP
jgi:hypothetical protein